MLLLAWNRMPIAAPSRMYGSRPMIATSRMTVGPITRAIFDSPTAICCWNRSLLLWSTLCMTIMLPRSPCQWRMKSRNQR